VAKIRRRIRLAEFFSTDIRRTEIWRLIQIFGGGLGVYVLAACHVSFIVHMCNCTGWRTKVTDWLIRPTRYKMK